LGHQRFTDHSAREGGNYWISSEFTAILDDRRARALAVKNNIPVLGSLRVIVIAKDRGLITAARPALERLRGVGAYVTDELIDRSIALADES